LILDVTTNLPPDYQLEDISLVSCFTTEYHQRWKQSTIDGKSIFRQNSIRSQNPREVVQEVYGWPLTLGARSTMLQAAEHAQISFTLLYWDVLNVIRRAIPQISAP